MEQEKQQKVALFRFAVLGDVLQRDLKYGELKLVLKMLSQKEWINPNGQAQRFSWKTLEEWYYQYKKLGFDGLMPQHRRDRGRLKSLPAEIEQIIIDMKREDSGRSARLILRELQINGVLRKGQVSLSTIQRLLKRNGLSGPRLELDRPARYRWQASLCGELWQTDAVHGPKLFDPRSGREIRVKIFALLDDKSRLITSLRGGFRETQADFLTVLASAVLRRGIPKTILTDNHMSFCGSDVDLCCAKLGIRLTRARPYDGPAKGKIERFWRNLRAQVLDRLDSNKVKTLDDLNVRLNAWVHSEYNRSPHSSLAGKTPLDAWQEDESEISWIEDPSFVEKALVAKLERSIKNDSTCSIHGQCYEVPTHLRRRKIPIYYSALRPQEFWVEDGLTKVVLKVVDPESNFSRSRAGKTKKVSEVKTGFNAVESFLQRVLNPLKYSENDHA
jgi:putative transposase